MVDVPTTSTEGPSEIATPSIVMPDAPALRVVFPFINNWWLLFLSNGVNVWPAAVKMPAGAAVVCVGAATLGRAMVEPSAINPAVFIDRTVPEVVRAAAPTDMVAPLATRVPWLSGVHVFPAATMPNAGAVGSEAAFPSLSPPDAALSF